MQGRGTRGEGRGTRDEDVPKGNEGVKSAGTTGEGRPARGYRSSTIRDGHIEALDAWRSCRLQADGRGAALPARRGERNARAVGLSEGARRKRGDRRRHRAARGHRGGGRARAAGPAPATRRAEAGRGRGSPSCTSSWPTPAARRRSKSEGSAGSPSTKRSKRSTSIRAGACCARRIA